MLLVRTQFHSSDQSKVHSSENSIHARKVMHLSERQWIANDLKKKLLIKFQDKQKIFSNNNAKCDW